jgi:hypothetical protein
MLVSQSPEDYTQFAAGTGFDTTWVLQNTGTGTWGTGAIDIRYLGAVNNNLMHQGADANDLAVDVPSGSTYDFTVSMIAAYDTGTCGELWEVGVGSASLCQFSVYITVP